MDWGFVTAILVTGMVIVFLALIGLVLVIYLTGHTASRFDKEKKRTETAPVSEPAPAPVVVASAPVQAAFVPPVGPGPVSDAVVGEGIPAKTVAAISAAVTVALEGQGSFAVKRIVRS